MFDYAPLYSKRERLLLILKLALVLGPIYLLSEYVFLPWLGNYASYANCYQYGDYNGVQLVMYGVFVGIPLSSALLVLGLYGPRCIRILRSGQDPPPGERVLRKTRYRRGKMALIGPVFLLLTLAAFGGIAVWGSFQAEKISRDPVPCRDEQKLELGWEIEDEV